MVQLVLPVFEVDGIDDALAAGQLEGAFNHRGFRAVDDQRCGDVSDETLEKHGGVRHFIPPDVGRADIEQVASFANLIAAQSNHAVDVTGGQHLPELLRAVGVGAFPDGQIGVVLSEGHRLIQATDRRLELVFTLVGRPAGDGVHHLGQVLGRRPAAAADDVHAVHFHEFNQPAGQLVGGQGIIGLAVDKLG